MRNIEFTPTPKLLVWGFTKMVAAGNDFVVIEDRGQRIEVRVLAKKICDRKYGIGADGMLLLEKTTKADIRMRIFNPDGSEAEMCGNGARCCAKYYNFKLSVLSYKPITIETKAGILEAIVNNDMVKLKMSNPSCIKSFVIARSPVQYTGSRLREGATKQSPEIASPPAGARNDNFVVNFINTGVPHTVIFVDDLENTDVDKLGREIRNKKEFAPAGTNVNFVKIIDKDTIAVRTYERGVEAETLACGTGAVASAIISNRHNVITRGKEILKICFDKKDNKISNVWLEGSAKIVFEGSLVPSYL